MEGPIPYILPDDFLYSRLIFSFMGVALLALACRRSKTWVSPSFPKELVPECKGRFIDYFFSRRRSYISVSL